MLAECHPHSDKMAHCADAVYGWDYADTDTEYKNNPNVIQPFLFLSGYGCAETDTETWNSGLILILFLFNSRFHAFISFCSHYSLSNVMSSFIYAFSVIYIASPRAGVPVNIYGLTQGRKRFSFATCTPVIRYTNAVNTLFIRFLKTIVDSSG